MLRLINKIPQFYFNGAGNTAIEYTFGTEHLLLLAREARTIEEFRLMLISEGRTQTKSFTASVGRK